MSVLPEYKTEPMSIWEFLKWTEYWWSNNTPTICLNFRVMGENGTYRYLSVGRRPPMQFDYLMEGNPGKYDIVDGKGGLMGELMDLSILFNLYKVSVVKEFSMVEYTVWLHRLEDGQDRNIDADLVEKFCEKVLGK